MKFSLYAFIVLAAAAATRAAGPALADGEKIVYRVAWTIVPVAGRITVSGEIRPEPSGPPLLHVVTETETRGLARLILPFTAKADSVFDQSGRIVRFTETSKTRDKQVSHSMAFDFPHARVAYTTGEGAAGTRFLELPPGEPTDLINCLLEARTWNLQPGQARDALVFFEDDFYQLTVHALGFEQVNTYMGSFRTVVLEPRMEKTPPLGMFKRGSTVKVWIAQDQRHLPVQFQVQFKFGSGVATLADYRPAAAASSRAPSGPAPAGRK